MIKQNRLKEEFPLTNTLTALFIFLTKCFCIDLSFSVVLLADYNIQGWLKNQRTAVEKLYIKASQARRQSRQVGPTRCQDSVWLMGLYPPFQDPREPVGQV